MLSDIGTLKVLHSSSGFNFVFSLCLSIYIHTSNIAYLLVYHFI